jgi:aryl-alcohol dehydrogenase-like predicted oxidoreductase
MERRRIGDSDLICSALGFGSWEMGDGYGPIDAQEASRTVGLAIDSGITLFDTAEIYGPLKSEDLLGRALEGRRNDVIIVTKVGFGFDNNDVCTGHDCSRKSILRRAEGCLKRLRTDRIDLLLIHWSDHRTPHEKTIGALEELKAAGKIRYYGVSNYNASMMEACMSHGHIVANQVGYHLFDRRMETQVLPFCAVRNVGFMAYGSLGFGLLTGALKPESTFQPPWCIGGVAFGLPLFQREQFVKELKVVERLKAMAARHGRTVAQLAIAWVLGGQAVSVALVGVKNRAELAENIEAVDWKLTAGDRAEIDRIFAEEDVRTSREFPQVLEC